jgi:hypothetical protein
MFLFYILQTTLTRDACSSDANYCHNTNCQHSTLSGASSVTTQQVCMDATLILLMVVNL